MTPEEAVIDAGSSATVDPPGQVVIMLAFVSTTSPEGSVSTNPKPDFAPFPALLFNVKISVEICPFATVVGKNFFVNFGRTVYVASITPEVPATKVLLADVNCVIAVVVSLVVVPPMTLVPVTAAVETSVNLTAYEPGTTYGNEYWPDALVKTEIVWPRNVASA
jgi:hypothetical protein